MTTKFIKWKLLKGYQRNSIKGYSFWDYIKMITPVDHDNAMDERNNNFLNESSSNEQQNNSGLTKAELRKVGRKLYCSVLITSRSRNDWNRYSIYFQIKLRSFDSYSKKNRVSYASTLEHSSYTQHNQFSCVFFSKCKITPIKLQ